MTRKYIHKVLLKEFDGPNSSDSVGNNFRIKLIKIGLKIARPIRGTPCTHTWTDVAEVEVLLTPISRILFFSFNMKIDGAEGRGGARYVARQERSSFRNKQQHLASSPSPPSGSFLTAEIFLFPPRGSQINNEVAYLCRGQRRSYRIPAVFHSVPVVRKKKKQKMKKKNKMKQRYQLYPLYASP